MITDGLIALPIAILSFLIGLLPAYAGLPSGMEASILWVGTQTLALGDLLPLDTLWVIVKLIVTIEIAIMGFNTLAWLAHWKQPKG